MPDATADECARAKQAFRAAQDALAFGDAGEAARLLSEWRKLVGRDGAS